jgi:2-desacetyl-2-hydroxyethyl bacteriochlorophyllide A dehydrogenase
MRALILNHPNDFAVVQADIPILGASEVLVKIHACGVCGTDVHIVDGHFPPTPFPITPGHESAGEVIAVAPGVTGLHVGDRVGVDASLSCGHCALCRRGDSNVCPDRGGIGGTIDGGFAEIAVVPAANCYPIAPHVSYREAAVAEPLSCVLHGIQLLRPTFQPSVLILGAGTMGLLTLQVMKSAGTSRVHVINRSPGRLPLASTLGADKTATSGEYESSTIPDLYDIVIEATGAPEMVALGLRSLKPRGQLLLLGVTSSGTTVELSPFDLYNNELSVLGSMGAKNTYGQALEAIANGSVSVGPLLTHAFPLERFADALATVRSGIGVKIQILPNHADDFILA